MSSSVEQLAFVWACIWRVVAQSSFIRTRSFHLTCTKTSRTLVVITVWGSFQETKAVKSGWGWILEVKVAAVQSASTHTINLLLHEPQGLQINAEFYFCKVIFPWTLVLVFLLLLTLMTTCASIHLSSSYFFFYLRFLKSYLLKIAVQTVKYCLISIADSSSCWVCLSHRFYI